MADRLVLIEDMFTSLRSEIVEKIGSGHAGVSPAQRNGIMPRTYALSAAHYIRACTGKMEVASCLVSRGRRTIVLIGCALTESPRIDAPYLWGSIFGVKLEKSDPQLFNFNFLIIFLCIKM